MNILKLIAANKEGIIKKTLLAGGTIIGLALAAGLTTDSEEEEIVVEPAEFTDDETGETIIIEPEDGETAE